MKYISCVTFGRFNLPHFGHVDLIETMLSKGEQAHVYVSTGGQNNNWDLRVLLLRVLCRRSQLDLSRVQFRKSRSPFRSVVTSTNDSEFYETALVLGEDQMLMGASLSSVLDVPLILNPRKFSSTNVRYLADSDETNSNLESYYNDNYATRLAKMLRQEEINRERFQKVTEKVA